MSTKSIITCRTQMVKHNTEEREGFLIMEIKVENEYVQHGRPLLKDDEPEPPHDDRRSLIQKAISQTFKSTAHLANLLPTGTVLTFQLLAPIFSNQGHCDAVSRSMTMGLIGLCGVSCFFLCFTDSFRDGNGKVCHALATFKGLWVIDGDSLDAPSPEAAASYRLTFIDFAHAFMSILVFGAIALFDQNVVSCFYPMPSEETKELLTALPVGIGVICSMLFVAFPTRRHGIGFSLHCD